MDIATIIGLISAFGLIIASILTSGDVTAFLDVPSVLIVILGSFAVLFVFYPIKDVLSLFKVLAKTVVNRNYEANVHVERLIKFGQLVRTEGILALEEAGKDVEDPFLKKGLMLAIDGTETEQILTQLEGEIAAIEERHKKGADMLAALGTVSPAMGLIGTLIGLVIMLQNMSDPSAIGPAMAVALLTTFYGAIMANVVFNPMAGKLRARSADESLYNTVIMVGIESISKGDNPRIIESRLNSLLPTSKRVAVFDK
ncbi:MAG: MotA/TolQ/ExbB proton channel family protein [Deltaproteobacteria bacterium]|nr:MotA/TolQ/ExbB proton channel family protein [Deltaproteobacteria bacterium]